MNTVGIDIGGTKISGVLVDAADQVLKEDRQPTPANCYWCNSWRLWKVSLPKESNQGNGNQWNYLDEG